MSDCSVTFHPQDVRVTVKQGTSLLDAAVAAHITINNLCGGDGICGRCKMIVKTGEVTGEVTGKLTREEIKQGYVLGCMAAVQSDLDVDIPVETLAKVKVSGDKEADRFKDMKELGNSWAKFTPAPLVSKVYIELGEPDLANNMADHQRICDLVEKKVNEPSMQMGLKILKLLPDVLREGNYKITATVGLRRGISEVMNIEAGNTARENYLVVIDIGTTTIVSHLVDAVHMKTVDAKACFNSQGMYGREVTGRMITAEKKGTEEFQKLLVKDINQLILGLSEDNGISLKNITAVVAAGNTAMGHFLLGLSTYNIRRTPYVAASVAPPPLRAAEVGIEINPRGLLYSLPGISGWVGSDLTAGILATGLYKHPELSLLVDIGTNGEIVIGNNDWMVSCSASAGPALEAASVECGMRAESGAIERVYAKDGEILYETIGEIKPKGICGSGLIDLLSVLLKEGIIDRGGKMIEGASPRIFQKDGIGAYRIVDEENGHNNKAVYITESEIENIITAKAAIFSAMKIILDRLDLSFMDIEKFYIAGAFGNYIDAENAITIGLIPNIPREKILFVGNTSVEGAKLAALYKEAFNDLEKISKSTTYYDLMGADDYVEEFQKALFLPHTDIQLFQGET